MLFAQRGPTMVPRDHRWPTLCEAGAKVGELTAAPLIWSRPGLVVQKSSTYADRPFDPCHLLPPKHRRIWLPLFPNYFFTIWLIPGTDLALGIAKINENHMILLSRLQKPLCFQIFLLNPAFPGSRGTWFPGKWKCHRRNQEVRSSFRLGFHRLFLRWRFHFFWNQVQHGNAQLWLPHRLHIDAKTWFLRDPELRWSTFWSLSPPTPQTPAYLASAVSKLIFFTIWLIPGTD